MNRQALFVSGIGLGAGLMFLLDPDRGARRRALVIDQLNHAANLIPRATRVTLRDMRNRAEGIASQAGSLFQTDTPSDEVLVQRIRSKMGRIVSHPHAVMVKAENGRVTLSGPVLSREVQQLVTATNCIAGVEDVVNELEVHQTSESHPSLQGGKVRRGDRPDVLQDNWSPTTRVAAGATGAALVAYGLTKREPLSLLSGTVGLGLLARGVTNVPISRVVGRGGRAQQ